MNIRFLIFDRAFFRMYSSPNVKEIAFFESIRVRTLRKSTFFDYIRIQMVENFLRALLSVYITLPTLYLERVRSMWKRTMGNFDENRVVKNSLR